jgi:hypothetical protein
MHVGWRRANGRRLGICFHQELCCWKERESGASATQDLQDFFKIIHCIVEVVSSCWQ